MLHIIIPRGKLWERIRKISLHNTKAQKVQKTANNKFVSSFDPFGSYTGTDFDYLYENFGIENKEEFFNEVAKYINSINEII